MISKCLVCIPILHTNIHRDTQKCLVQTGLTNEKTKIEGPWDKGLNPHGHFKTRTHS